jgi:hypothetical protein
MDSNYANKRLLTTLLASYYQPVRLAYQPPANSTFLSEQTSHQQPASSTFLSEQTSTSHQPPAKRTGCICVVNILHTLVQFACQLDEDVRGLDYES